MVQGVGATGDSGSLNNMQEYQIYYPQYQQYKQAHPESSINFEGWLEMKGKIHYFNQQTENYIESGGQNFTNGDGINGNTIAADSHLSSSSGAIYQAEDDETYYQFDWDTGDYRVLHGNDEIAAELGVPEGVSVDMIDFGYKTAQIFDITFGELDDGQDTTNYNLNGIYGNVLVTDQEFDIHYILDALLMDPSDPQYQIAKSVFDKLCNNINQWLPDADLDMLNEVAEKYGTNSAEYKAVLKDVLLRNLDQANEWIEEHTHVANTGNMSSLEEIGSTNGTDGSEDAGSSSGETTTIPDYDKIDVLTTAGLANAYSRGDTRKVESTNNSEGNRRKELEAQMDADLETIANALVTELGDQMTDEIQSYINKAKTAVVAKSELIRTWSEKHGFLNMHKKTLGEYSIKDVADAFFNEFNTLCANGGKTTQEVAAEQQAAQEKAAQEEAAYKELYGMNMNSIASDAGVNKNIQVVNPTSAADIQAKAESDILQPLINKVKSQLSGKGISDSDLTAALSQCSQYALQYTTEWATTTNNCVYTIDANKLIDKFEEAIKAYVENTGYSFAQQNTTFVYYEFFNGVLY